MQSIQTPMKNITISGVTYTIEHDETDIHLIDEINDRMVVIDYGYSDLEDEGKRIWDREFPMLRGEWDGSMLRDYCNDSIEEFVRCNFHKAVEVVNE